MEKEEKTTDHLWENWSTNSKNLKNFVNLLVLRCFGLGFLFTETFLVLDHNDPSSELCVSRILLRRDEWVVNRLLVISSLEINLRLFLK